MILEDRHTDVKVTVFASEGAAVAAARFTTEVYLCPRTPEEIEAHGLGESVGAKLRGWSYNAYLDGEGSAIRVEPAEVVDAAPGETERGRE